MNRVRYGKTNEHGVKTSSTKLVGDKGVELQVNVNTKENTFNIVALPEGFVKAEGSAVSYQLVLREVKKALLGLGVGLTTESRDRGFKGVLGHSHNGTVPTGATISAKSVLE